MATDVRIVPRPVEQRLRCDKCGEPSDHFRQYIDRDTNEAYRYCNTCWPYGTYAPPR